MANAGRGVTVDDPDVPYYQAGDPDALLAAFESIIDGVRSCVFTLDGVIQTGFEQTGRVTVNNLEVPYLDPNGWRANNPSEIELLGDSCVQIQDGEVSIAIEFACDGIIPQ